MLTDRWLLGVVVSVLVHGAALGMLAQVVLGPDGQDSPARVLFGHGRASASMAGGGAAEDRDDDSPPSLISAEVTMVEDAEPPAAAAPAQDSASVARWLAADLPRMVSPAREIPRPALLTLSAVDVPRVSVSRVQFVSPPEPSALRTPAPVASAAEGRSLPAGPTIEVPVVAGPAIGGSALAGGGGEASGPASSPVLAAAASGDSAAGAGPAGSAGTGPTGTGAAAGKGGSGGQGGAENGAHVANLPKPVYPQGCLRRGLQGLVVLEVEVLAAGACGKIRVYRSSGVAELDRAAVAAAEQARFVPAQRGGRSVDSTIMIPVRFVIEG